MNMISKIYVLEIGWVFSTRKNDILFDKKSNLYIRECSDGSIIEYNGHYVVAVVYHTGDTVENEKTAILFNSN